MLVNVHAGCSIQCSTQVAIGNIINGGFSTGSSRVPIGRPSSLEETSTLSMICNKPHNIGLSSGQLQHIRPPEEYTF